MSVEIVNQERSNSIRLALSLLAAIVATSSYVLLFCIAAISMMGDPSLSALDGLSWALDTPEHRLKTLIVLGAACPIGVVMAGYLRIGVSK